MKKSIIIITFILLSMSLFSSSIGWGNLQWPNTISVVVGDTTENIYGQVWMDGQTNLPGQADSIYAELGYGADGTSPDETWTWFLATYFGESGSNDEYVYNLVCSMAAGEYDYTYRYHHESDPIDDFYYAGNVGDLTVSSAPLPTYNVTFQVDMQNQTVSADSVHIAGAFQDWDPAGTVLTDPDMDDIYTVTLELEAGTYQFKYVNGDEWGEDESVPGACAVDNNREVTTPAADTTLTVVCYGECGPCTPLTNQDVTVTFQVYMGDLDPAWYQGGVSVQGSLDSLDWNAGSNMLTDPDEDLMYTGEVIIPAGTFPNGEYKFARNDSARAWYWEDSNNRPFAIDDSGSTQTLDMVYWNDSMPIPSNITTEIIGSDVLISWDSVFGADYYNIYRSTDPYDSFGTAINVFPIGSETYTDQGASSGTKYFYQVKAFKN